MLESLQFIYAPQIVNGLSIGVAVVLMALGLTIIFGLLDVINMSHGEFYAAGAFISVSLMTMGISFWFCLLLVPLLLIPIGFAMERLLIQKVFHYKDRHILTLLLTFGVAMVLEDAYKIIWGANPIKPSAPISGASELLGVMFPNYRLFLMGFGALLIFSVWTFSVVIVGGLGSIKGALIAGILLTQLQSISSLYISPVWSDPLVFTVMVLVLMFKPTGLYGGMKNA